MRDRKTKWFKADLPQTCFLYRQIAVMERLVTTLTVLPSIRLDVITDRWHRTQLQSFQLSETIPSNTMDIRCYQLPVVQITRQFWTLELFTDVQYARSNSVLYTRSVKNWPQANDKLEMTKSVIPEYIVRTAFSSLQHKSGSQILRNGNWGIGMMKTYLIRKANVSWMETELNILHVI